MAVKSTNLVENSNRSLGTVVVSSGTSCTRNNNNNHKLLLTGSDIYGSDWSGVKLEQAEEDMIIEGAMPTDHDTRYYDRDLSSLTELPNDEEVENYDSKGFHIKTEIADICSSCGDVIRDRFILHVANRAWHSHCLRCCVCQTNLDRESSCFLKEDNLYCKYDYNAHYGAKCFKCARIISPTDWVRKAKENVYHLACFSCDSCRRQLSTGEQFGIIDDKVLCRIHFLELRDGCSSSSDDSGESSESHSKKKTKRMRTTFTEDQIQILQANFQIDSNPDGQDLERIAQITGLSKRVTQVWFQNCRARQKKYVGTPATNKRNSHHNSGSALSVAAMSSHEGLSPVPPQDHRGTNQIDLRAMYTAYRTQMCATSSGDCVNAEDLSITNESTSII